MRSILFSFVFVTLATSIAFSREWTDTTGQFKAQAEFIEVKGTVVRLRTPEGKVCACEFDRLSVGDQGFVTRTIAARQAGETSPVETAPQAAANHRPAAFDVQAKRTRRVAGAARNETQSGSPETSRAIARRLAMV
jgi:hypothetical protein